MSESYLETLKQVSTILKKFPSKDQLFNKSRKIVLVLDTHSVNVYKLLHRKFAGNQLFHILSVPDVLGADNVTFVFPNLQIFATGSKAIEEIAQKIF
jgi:hypothetical protein